MKRSRTWGVTLASCLIIQRLWGWSVECSMTRSAHHLTLIVPERVRWVKIVAHSSGLKPPRVTMILFRAAA